MYCSSVVYRVVSSRNKYKHGKSRLDVEKGNGNTFLCVGQPIGLIYYMKRKEFLFLFVNYWSVLSYDFAGESEVI